MLAVPLVNSFGWSYLTQAVGTTTPGVSITPGFSNAEGSWTSIATGANIAFDVFYVTLVISGGSVGANACQQLLDFGWDAAGGTAYVAWMSNLIMGQSPFPDAGSRAYHFPCRIPAGSQVAVRVQSSTASGTVRVQACLYGKRSRPELWPGAAYSETIGTITNSTGVVFTPGSGAYGSWQSLGTTVKPLWWWQLGFQINDATVSFKGTNIQLAVGDATNKHTLIDTHVVSTSVETLPTPLQANCAWAVPAGSTLYVRGYCNTTPDDNFNAAAIGFGG